MAKFVNSKYISFYTIEYWDELTEKAFDETKFREDYKNNPNRMTDEQIKMNGGFDSLYADLRDKFLHTKQKSKYTNIVEVSKQIIYTITDVIKEKFPNLICNVTDGYCEYKYRFHFEYAELHLAIKGSEDEGSLYITPTLRDSDNNYFNVKYFNERGNIGFECSDIELINIIEHFANKEYRKIGLYKVYNRCENQYVLSFGSLQFEMYDIVMVQLYHTLAKVMNEKFGTDYPYSQQTIDNLWKQKEFGNIKRVGKFFLDNTWYKSKFLLKETYFYDEGKKVADLQCYANYGEYTKEELCELLDTLKPYVLSNYFAETSKVKLDEKYGFYRKHNIGFSETPNYFHLIKWEE